MRTHLTVVLALALASSLVVVAPVAQADTCASTIAENTLCTPVYALYCAMYGGKYVVSCEANVVRHCLDACPRDLDGILVLP